MRSAIALLFVVFWPAYGQLRDVVKSDDVDKMFARATPSIEVLSKPNLALVFRVSSGNAGSWQPPADAEEFWFARHGAADVSLRIGGASSSETNHKVAEGDVFYLRRNTGYRVTPGASGFEYVAVRVFPAERPLGIGIGATGAPRPMPTVARKAEIDATFASADKNVTLHSAGATLINHVVYKGAPGPWEVHQTCDDYYFMRVGTARAQIDGTVVNGKVDSPGEIRGTGVTGARSFNIGPGDMVVIPRNTAHFMDPGSNKLGYLLVKVCD